MCTYQEDGIFLNALSGQSQFGACALLSPCVVLCQLRQTNFAPLWSMQVAVSSPRSCKIYCSYLTDEPASRYAPHTGPFGHSHRFPLGHFRHNPAFCAGRILRGADLQLLSSCDFLGAQSDNRNTGACHGDLLYFRLACRDAGSGSPAYL